MPESSSFPVSSPMSTNCYAFLGFSPETLHTRGQQTMALGPKPAHHLFVYSLGVFLRFQMVEK